jgi:translation initiation factor IF-3
LNSSSGSGSGGNFKGGTRQFNNSSGQGSRRPSSPTTGSSPSGSSTTGSSPTGSNYRGGSYDRSRSPGYSQSRPPYSGTSSAPQSGTSYNRKPYGSSPTGTTSSAAGTTSTPAPASAAGAAPATGQAQAGYTPGSNFNRRPPGQGGFNRTPRPTGQGGGGGYQRREFGNRREGPPEAHRINHKISAREVRVVSDSGEQLGVLQINEAISIAERDGLDLVEVAPQANPPVCKIMDYGKFKYKEQKKEAEAKKKRTESTLKELRIRYRTDSGDLETKLKQAKDFLLEGDKVKFSMRFKGREAAFMNLGVEKFNQIVHRLAEVASVDERSPTTGRQIHITLAPLKVAVPVKPKKAEVAATASSPTQSAVATSQIVAKASESAEPPKEESKSES